MKISCGGSIFIELYVYVERLDILVSETEVLLLFVLFETGILAPDYFPGVGAPGMNVPPCL